MAAAIPGTRRGYGEGRIGGLAVVAPCPVGVEAAEKLVMERRHR